MKIGKSLQHYRINNGMTQEQLATILNVSRQTISKWENDRSYPDIENLIWLCDLYHISLDELVGRKKIIYEAQNIRTKNIQTEKRITMEKVEKLTGSLVAFSAFLSLYIGGPIVLLLIVSIVFYICVSLFKYFLQRKQIKN